MTRLSRLGRATVDVAQVLTHEAGELLVRQLRRRRKRRGQMRPIMITSYSGYGNEREVYLQGRVLEAFELSAPRPDAPWWENARMIARRFRAVEVPEARIKARFKGDEQETLSDGEGFFQFCLLPKGGLARESEWHGVELELVETVSPGQGRVTALGPVLVPSAAARFGVVSDMDDTVIESHATNFMKIAAMTLMNNALTRSPLAGVGAFYRALRDGRTGGEQNPIFYVSSSGWNLYDLFADFLEINRIPVGPILLRELRFGRRRVIATGHGHKLDKIRHILRTTGALPFVLVGDSGQDDPFLYRQIAEEFPGRIHAVYIRAISWRDRTHELEPVLAAMKELGVPMLVVTDTLAAARHAAELGLLAPERLEEIHAESLATPGSTRFA